MKTIVFLVLFTILSLPSFSKKNIQPVNRIIGTWKFSKQTQYNDLQHIPNNDMGFQTEFFTFEPNHRFTHEFTGEIGQTVRLLKGNWKFEGDKLRIDYSGIHYSLTTDYFYIDSDLVLGKNFNHVIFTRYNVDFMDIAAK